MLLSSNNCSKLFDVYCVPRSELSWNQDNSDRGCHYRWPGWIERMDNAGFIRSMSKKGCSPDNSAYEGFFGRLKKWILLL